MGNVRDEVSLLLARGQQPARYFSGLSHATHIVVWVGSIQSHTVALLLYIVRGTLYLVVCNHTFEYHAP